MLSLDRVEKDDTSEINVTDNVHVNRLPIVPAIVSKDPYDYSSDSSGQGTRFAKRTGNFDLDFPESPKTSKMKGQQLKKSTKNVAKISEVSIGNNKKTIGSESESDTVIQPSGVPMKQQDACPDSSDVPSEAADSSMDNITFKRGRHGRQRSMSIFYIYFSLNILICYVVIT